MNFLDKTVEQVTKDTILLLLIVCLFLVVFPGRQNLITGLVFGTIIALLNFRLLKLTVSKFVRAENPKRFLKRAYFKRLLIYAVAFAVAVRKQNINNATVVLGFFLPKITIYFDVWRKKNVLHLKERVSRE